MPVSSSRILTLEKTSFYFGLFYARQPKVYIAIELLSIGRACVILQSYDLEINSAEFIILSDDAVMAMHSQPHMPSA
jgi:hypothetical protein